jgi:RsiW-degrading membrane proteinase PrsW (M82 family)
MILLVILLGLLPSFAWLFFFLAEDIHPEPKKIIARVFIAGALAALVALLLQFLSQKFLAIFYIGQYNPLCFLLFSTIEEVLKFSAAYFIIRRSRFFDEPIDAMIYMITAALGFALLENLGVILSTKTIGEALSISVLRFVGATLLHALSSGLVGYYWALGLIRKKIKTFIFAGLVLATFLHTTFNYLIMIFNTILIYPTIFLIIVALFILWDFEKIKGFVQKSELSGE